jgi:hypothetical protein
MLDTGSRVSIDRTTASEGAPIVGTVLALTCQVAAVALQALAVGEVEDNRPWAANMKAAAPTEPSRAPGAAQGALPYLTALIIAVTLVFTWAGLRSL